MHYTLYSFQGMHQLVLRTQRYYLFSLVFYLNSVVSDNNTLLLHVQPMDLSWNPYSCGRLFMSAPGLVEILRGQQCPISREFFRALAICHTVMAEYKNGEAICEQNDLRQHVYFHFMS